MGTGVKQSQHEDDLLLLVLRLLCRILHPLHVQAFHYVVLIDRTKFTRFIPTRRSRTDDQTITRLLVLNDVMVIMLVTEAKVRGFKPGRRRRIFKGDKVRGTTSFTGDVKPSAPCRKILRHVKEPQKNEKRYL
jgi:hypothetical protein